MGPSSHGWYAAWQSYGLFLSFAVIGGALGWWRHPVTAAVVAAAVMLVATTIDWSTGPEASVTEWQIAAALAAIGALVSTLVPGLVCSPYLWRNCFTDGSDAKRSPSRPHGRFGAAPPP